MSRLANRLLGLVTRITPVSSDSTRRGISGFADGTGQQNLRDVWTKDAMVRRQSRTLTPRSIRGEASGCVAGL